MEGVGFKEVCLTFAGVKGGGGGGRRGRRGRRGEGERSKKGDIRVSLVGSCINENAFVRGRRESE